MAPSRRLLDGVEVVGRRHAIEQTHRVQCRIDRDGVATSRPHEDAIDATPTRK
jgi:hypothetical protein